MRRVRVVISGMVQGVFFRVSAREEAVRRGVAGWIRNRPDGDVEAVFEGPDRAVEHMVAWCREGTSLADVQEVEVVPEEPEGLTRFEII